MAKLRMVDKLIDKRIVSPDTSIVYGRLCWLTDWTAELGSVWTEAAIIVCVVSMTE